MEVSNCTVSKSVVKVEARLTDGSCRVCMSSSSKMVHLFGEETDGIVERILFCTGLQFTKEDVAPSLICSLCIENLDIAYKFKTQCILSDQTYKNYLYKSYNEIEFKSEKDLNICETSLKYEDDSNNVGAGDLECGFEWNHSDTEYKSEIYNEDFGSNGKKLKRKRLKREPSSANKRRGLKLKNNNLSTAEKPISVTEPRKKRGPYKKRNVEKEKREREKLVTNEHFICEMCGKVFQTRTSLCGHRKYHLPPSYACDHCPFQTCKKRDLVDHIRRHAGIKVNQCTLCPRSFTTTSNLKDHIRRVHEKVKPFRCHLCPWSFYNRNKLNAHITTHTGVKSFECEVCHSRFARRDYWIKHMRALHGVSVPARKPGKQKTLYQAGLDGDWLIT